MICAGRGWGKTRVGAETINQWAGEGGPGGRMFLVGRTVGDVRDTMIEGESGILATSKKGNRPVYKPAQRRVIWPSGVIATTYSAEEPKQFRGPQHHRGWCDEIAAWRDSWEAWRQLLLGLRLKGWGHARCVVTTTPQPKRVIRDLLSRSQLQSATPRVHWTKGTTYDNLENLDETFAAEILSMYEGTRMGRQELEAELLDDVPGALWKRAWFDREGFRLTEPPPLLRTVVAVDPPASSGASAAEAGINAMAIGENMHLYVLGDYSLQGTPHVWGTQAVTAYHQLKADRLVAEVNQGGDMVIATILNIDKKVATRAVHASKGKRARAEPLSNRYEKGEVHHVGVFTELEDQMVTWDGTGTSPDRIDALVWASADLEKYAPRKHKPYNPLINTVRGTTGRSGYDPY